MSAGPGPGSSAMQPAQPRHDAAPRPSAAPHSPQSAGVAAGDGTDGPEPSQETSGAQRIELIRIAAEMQEMSNSAITRHYASRIYAALGMPVTCACFACVPVTPRGEA